MKCTGCIKEASDIHIRTSSWQSLARLSYAVACRPPPIPESISEAAAAATDAAMKLLCNHSNEEVPVEDANAVAQLCFAIGKLRSDKGIALWALGTLPNLDEPM